MSRSMVWLKRWKRWLVGEAAELSPFATAVEKAAQRAPEPIVVPIDDELDLHTYKPKEARYVVASYLEAAQEKGFTEVRVIHGKGKGILKKSIRAYLDRDPHVKRYCDAPAQRGGWGATIVYLKEKSAVDNPED